MQRYFAHIVDHNVELSSDDLHHLTHVMRMRVGDFFEVVDEQNLYVCEIKSLNPLQVNIDRKEEDVELNSHITLFFALAKGDKIDLVIQKATELGVHRIVLFKSRRCVVNFDHKDINKKIERYQKIAKEASEQCHRLVIPEIKGVIDIKEIPQYKEEVNLLAYEKRAGHTADFNLKNPKGVSIVIGSEGGFDEEEVEFLINQGFEIISLGKRILRCETAAIYALSVLGHQLEK